MKTHTPAPVLLLSLFTAAALASPDDNRAENTVVLDPTAVANLRIETVMAEPTEFEETAFALGVIEPRPGRIAAVSSRIPGRVVGLTAYPGDHVESGAEVVRVESRQPGQPAPVIGLAAPLRGVITRLDVRLGDPVEPDRALLEVTDLDEVLAVARVPDHLAGRLAPGTTAHIRLAALPDRTLTGALVRFGTAADAAHGTIDAYFLLPNPDHRLRPGMRAEFSLVLHRRSGVVAVPREAVQGDLANRFVYVRDFDLPHAFVKTPVVTGLTNDRFVEIVKGLLPADEVVTRGAYSLAFAGGGSVSLKEALDAAHGHEHNPDGSEITPGNKPAGTATGNPNLAPGDATSPGISERPWMVVSGVLFVLLLLVGFRRRGPGPTRPEKA